MQVLISSSDPCLRFILNVHNEDNIVTSSPRKHVLTVELREHYTDVIHVCISWNESVKEEDHANVTLVIRSMEVDVDTFTEVDIELHITVTKGSVNPVVIRTNNC